MRQIDQDLLTLSALIRDIAQHRVAADFSADGRTGVLCALESVFEASCRAAMAQRLAAQETDTALPYV
jgi:hypothetical protein